jgi:hypothetical protein
VSSRVQDQLEQHSKTRLKENMDNEQKKKKMVYEQNEYQ